MLKIAVDGSILVGKHPRIAAINIHQRVDLVAAAHVGDAADADRVGRKIDKLIEIATEDGLGVRKIGRGRRFMDPAPLGEANLAQLAVGKALRDGELVAVQDIDREMRGR